MFTWVNSEKGPKLDYAGNALPDCVVFSVKQHNLHLKLKVFWFGGVIGSGQSTGHTLAQHVNGMTWWVNSPVLHDTGHWNNTPTVTSDSSGRGKYSKIYLHQIRILYIDLQRHAFSYWRRHDIFDHLDFPENIHYISHHQKAFRLSRYPTPFLMKLTSFYKFGLWDGLSQQNFWWPSKR